MVKCTLELFQGCTDSLLCGNIANITSSMSVYSNLQCISLTSSLYQVFVQCQLIFTDANLIKWRREEELHRNDIIHLYCLQSLDHNSNLWSEKCSSS